MDTKVIKLGDTEIEKFELYHYKSHILIINIDINKTVVCNKHPFGKQNFK